VRELGLEIELYEATKHSFGTYYINNGASKDLLKEWFGHTNIKSTELYAKIKVVDAFREMQERNAKVINIETVTNCLRKPILVRVLVGSNPTLSAILFFCSL
jgi:hypothetical protein